MRIPKSKVYRAFPELDCFSDEQCRRFLGAAKRGAVRRVARFVAQCALAGGAAGLVWAGLALVAYALTLEPSRFGWGMWNFVGLLVLLLVLGCAGMTWLFVRDWLLRRRIARVIRTRGSCAACAYTLVGLPVGAALKVVCPECGFELVADPALGEVVNDEAGAPHFLPSPDIVPAIVRWLTPRRKRMIRRTAAIAVAALAFLAAIGWGSYEWFLRWQAGRARADRNGVAGLRVFVEEHQPPGTDPDSSNAWDPFLQAVVVMARTDIAVTREGPVEYGPDQRPEYSFDSIYAPESFGEGPEGEAKAAAARALAVTMLDAYRRAGVFALLDDMAARPRAVQPLADPGPDEPLAELRLPELGSARNTARMGAARMKLAQEAGDLPEFSGGLESNLALVRMLKSGPIAIDWLVGVAIEALTLERVKECLATRPDARWLDAIDMAMDRQRSTVPYTEMLRAEKMATLDTVAWVFADPERVRGGRFGTGVSTLTGRAGWNVPDKPLGTYRENRDAIATRFDDLIALSAVEPFERDRVATRPEPRLVLFDLLMAWVGPRVNDQMVLRERGIKTLLALERFRCEHGAYPDSLSDLVPGMLDAVPPDPWSGRDLCYRHIRAESAAADSFILYSVGADGVDNGGVAPQNEMEALNPGVSAGYDFVLGPAHSSPNEKK